MPKMPRITRKLLDERIREFLKLDPFAQPHKATSSYVKRSGGVWVLMPDVEFQLRNADGRRNCTSIAEAGTCNTYQSLAGLGAKVERQFLILRERLSGDVSDRHIVDKTIEDSDDVPPKAKRGRPRKTGLTASPFPGHEHDRWKCPTCEYFREAANNAERRNGELTRTIGQMEKEQAAQIDELARFFVFFMEECGTSSKAMVRYIFTGVEPNPIEHPLDNDDWYRCVRALMAIPGIGETGMDYRIGKLMDMPGWGEWKQDMIRVVDIRKQLDEFHKRT